MASPLPPRDRAGFEIAIICALVLEAECVQALFDKVWDGVGKNYGKAPGDPNAYTTGVIGEHNVVLAHMPRMGSTSAAAVAAAMRVSFRNMKLALVVGVCGGVPCNSDQQEIVLGDIIISQALVQYDFGRQYPEGFETKTGVQDILGPTSLEIQSLLAKLRTDQQKQRLQNNVITHLRTIQENLPATKYPGIESDVLYQSFYVHQHHASPTCRCSERQQICDAALKSGCEELGCGIDMRVERKRLANASTTEPLIHFGIMGSANMVMKSGRHRDQVAQKHDIIAFEMEGAGIWNQFPSIVIKGVCDYADSHKRKGWQRYAAATAAACAKTFLAEVTAEEMPTSPVPDSIFCVPKRRLKKFIGREDELEKISSFFNQEAERPQILVLHALGGQGKTQIALEYCYRLQGLCGGIIWVNCSTASAATQSFVGIAHQLDEVAMASLRDDKAKILFVLRTLRERYSRWLMVLDNCDDPAYFSDLDNFIPQGGKGNVLITTRHRGLSELGTIIDIPPMPVRAGVELLLHRYSGIDVDAYMPEGSEIIHRLGHLALAIDQASAYMEYTQLSVDKITDFLPQFIARRQTVLQHTTDHLWRYMKIVDESGKEKAINAFTTWEMSFQQLLNNRDLGDSAAHFLTLAAFLGPTQVDESLFGHHWKWSDPRPEWYDIFTTSSSSEKECEGSPSEESEMMEQGQAEASSSSAIRTPAHKNLNTTWNGESFWRLTRQIYQMSLAQSILPSTESEGASFTLHPLMRDWLQLRLGSKKRQDYSLEAVDVIATSIRAYEIIPSNADTKMRLLLRMDSIITSMNEYFGDGYRLGQDISTCNSCGWFAFFYRRQGRLQPSYNLYCTALETRARLLGREHPDTLTSMHNLALVLRNQGNYDEAEQMYRKVTKVRETILGKEHLDTLTSINNLASVLTHQGNYDEAEQMYRKVTKVRETILGKEHPNTLMSINNLASVLIHQGNYDEAEQMYRKVTKLSERILGKEHLDTLTSINNLALVLIHQGNYDEAEQIYRKVIKVRETILGKEHPNTLTSINNLALVLIHQGNYDEAEQMYRKVTKLSEMILGKEHPNTLLSVNNLACCLKSQNRNDEAIALMLSCVERSTAWQNEQAATTGDMEQSQLAEMRNGEQIPAIVCDRSAVRKRDLLKGFLRLGASRGSSA